MKDFLLGAHTSTTGGLHNALLEGQRLGATTIQFFTSNQKQWKGRVLKTEELELWDKTREATGLKQLMSHASYLINLGGANVENMAKSRLAFQQEIERCHQLEVSYLNFHPGTAGQADPQLCLDRIIENILSYESLLAQGKTQLILEATAGQGTCVGHKFEQLAYIIQAVQNKVPIGVCIDTCHIFVAGYDIRTAEGWEKVLNEFNQTIGLQYLETFHLNDSLKGLGSRVDRHAPLGQGMIGWECFKFLMTDTRTQHLPKYLETPDREKWAQEIETLRGCSNLKTGS